ncbi:MAG: hypothetical protein ACH0QD_13300 [Tepidibacillus sp.]
MKKSLLSLLFTFLLTLSAITPAFAEEPPKAPPLSMEQIEPLVAGNPVDIDILTTLYALFPPDALLLNELILQSYSEDPNTPYIDFLDYQDQVLYHSVGQFLIKTQARGELHESLILTIPNVLVKGTKSVYNDNLGVLTTIYRYAMQSHQILMKY